MRKSVKQTHRYKYFYDFCFVCVGTMPIQRASGHVVYSSHCHIKYCKSISNQIIMAYAQWIILQIISRLKNGTISVKNAGLSW